MCRWELFMVGMTVLPARSTTVAPGAVTPPFVPIAVIVPSSTTNAPFSIGAASVPKIRRAPSYSTAVDRGGSVVDAPEQAVIAPATTLIAQLLYRIVFLLGVPWLPYA